MSSRADCARSIALRRFARASRRAPTGWRPSSSTSTATSPALDLPIDVQATAFQWKVWRALQAIPYGRDAALRRSGAVDWSAAGRSRGGSCVCHESRRRRRALPPRRRRPAAGLAATGGAWGGRRSSCGRKRGRGVKGRQPAAGQSGAGNRHRQPAVGNRQSAAGNPVVGNRQPAPAIPVTRTGSLVPHLSAPVGTCPHLPAPIRTRPPSPHPPAPVGTCPHLPAPAAPDPEVTSPGAHQVRGLPVD